MLFPSLLHAIDTYQKQCPDKLCLADSAEEICYRDYARRIVATCALLQTNGIQQGDRVVLKAKQTISYLCWCHAIQLAGGIAVPLENSAGDMRVEQILALTEASMYVGDAPLGDAKFVPYDAQSDLALSSADMTQQLPDPQQISMILFTTGTTGASKGIVVTHMSEVAVAENVMYGVSMKPDNIEIIPTPMNHSFSLRRYYANLIRGATVVLLEGIIFLQQLFDALDRYKATAIALVPAALSVIFKLSRDQIGQYNHQLDYVQFGSAPLPEADKERITRLLPDCRLYNIYGSTESGCACSLNFNSADNMPGCIGFPNRHAHFIVTDAQHNQIESSPEHIGFLAYRGAMAMEKYYNEPELTERTIIDGYLYTKDLGYIDAQGRVYMLGRDDDVINTGGNKVSPGEIEECARRYEGVEDCICGATKDAVMGEVPLLYIVAGDDLDLRALHQYLSQHLEGFKVPKRIARINQVPRTYNGKIWRAKFAEIKALRQIT
ncbi:acyl--CoA ligase [Eubacteriales bacterium OttesenSCG-928-N13]|nr:acyl--CoA ligase [Eubacteriales bacterium OttesenSCG-928-N13]